LSTSRAAPVANRHQARSRPKTPFFSTRSQLSHCSTCTESAEEPYQEHKRACLEPAAGDDRSATGRERSCRAWQAMLAEERERLAREGGQVASSPP
jgi:hypothetical protein